MVTAKKKDTAMKYNWNPMAAEAYIFTSEQGGRWEAQDAFAETLGTEDQKLRRMELGRARLVKPGRRRRWRAG
jgi:hypothetical protein